MPPSDVRVRVGATVDTASLSAADAGLSKLAVSIKGVEGASAGFSTDVLALNPELAALVTTAQQGAAATQTLADTQILAGQAAGQNASATTQSTTALAQQGAEVQDLTQLYDALEQQAKETATATDAVAKSDSGVSAGQVASRTAGLGAIVGSAGGQGFRDASQIIQLATTFGVAGAAAGVFAVGLRAVTQGQEEAAQAAQQYANQLKGVAGQIAGGATTADIQGTIRQLEIQRQVQLQGRDSLQLLVKQFNDTTKAFDAGTLSLDTYHDTLVFLNEQTATLTGGQVTSVNQLDGAILQSQKNINDTSASIAVYNSQLGTQQVAINDAAAANQKAADDTAAAEKALADQRKQALDIITASQVGLAEDAARAQTLTTEQRKAEIEAIGVQITSLEAAIDTYEITGEAAKQLNAEITGLQNRQVALTDVTISYADVQQQLTDQIAEQLGVISDSIGYYQQLAGQIRSATVEQTADRLQALNDERDAINTYLPELERLAPSSADAAKALADAQDRLVQIGEDTQDLFARVVPAALGRAYSELTSDLADIQAKSQVKLDAIEAERGEAEAKAKTSRDDAYEKAEAKRSEALTDLAEKQAADRAQIERKSNVTITNAIYGRNALAAFLALQQKQQDLADLDERGKARAKEIDKQAVSERKQADDNYRKAQQQAQQAADKALALEKKRANDEIKERINAYNTQIGILTQFTQQSGVLFNQFRVNGLNAIGEVANAIKNLGTVNGINPNPVVTEYPGLPPGVVLPPVTGTAALVGAANPDARGAYGAVGLPGVVSLNSAALAQALAARPPTPVRGALTPQRLPSPAPPSYGMLTSGNQQRPLIINNKVIGTQMTQRDIRRIADDQLAETLTEAGYE